MLTASPLDQLAGIGHRFFGREGGVSEGIYASLNCGPGSRDNPEAVAQNRSLAMAQLGLRADQLVTCYQIHSAEAVIVRETWAQENAPRADAMATDVPGICLGILTADCVPVLFADPEARVIGAAHAGWKGAVGGVLEAVISAMTSLGAVPSRITATIGPAIQQASYEVGPEFPGHFADAARFFTPATRPGHHLFDLPGYVGSHLRRLNLAAIGNLGLDTCSLDRSFFSYRRATLNGEPDYGRFLSAIVLR